ncbi:MAG: hypothetical protein JW720_11175 [Sedimentisphaerales bacterium]|nr:hypothetical protein [Sedimentisphaerales bacterium]
MSRRLIITICMFVATLLVMGVVFAEDDATRPIDPNAIRHAYRPVLKYAVASPRACLIGPPDYPIDRCWRPQGDADNFARRNGRLRVPVGTRVIFCLSRDIEGVWYSGSYGCLGASMVLQICRPCQCIEPDPTQTRPDPNYCDPDPNCCSPDPNECIYARCRCENCLRLGAVECPSPDDPAIVPCPWVTIGKDGARACRKGPSIGRARIGVPVHFRRPGIYLLRAIVHTFAKPGYPLPLDQWRDCFLTDPADTTAVLPDLPPAEDKDVIYIRVRVVDNLIDDVEPDDIPTDDPDFTYIKPMPKDVDPNEPVVLDSDLNGDEVIDLADFAIMGQQWGRQYETPFTDDE